MCVFHLTDLVEVKERLENEKKSVITIIIRKMKRWTRLKHVRIAAGVQRADATTHGLAQIHGTGRVLDGIGKVIGKLVDDVVVVVWCRHGLDVAGGERKGEIC